MYAQVQIPFFFFLALHEALSDDLPNSLSDHSPHACIVCNPDAFSEDEVLVL